MKKKKKAYFSKTFIYLVLLIAVVAGFFLMVNYATNQKLSLNSMAAKGGDLCKSNGGRYYARKDYGKENATCSQVAKKEKDQRIFTDLPYGDKDFICCKAGAVIRKNCRDVGGTDWYRATSLEDFKLRYYDDYTVNAADYTSYTSEYYQNQYKGKLCIKIYSKRKLPTCSSVGGEWKKDNCYLDEGDKYYYTATSPNGENLADYKKGFMCCKKGDKLPPKSNNQTQQQ
jgi:hypothetical protein